MLKYKRCGSSGAGLSKSCEKLNLGTLSLGEIHRYVVKRTRKVTSGGASALRFPDRKRYSKISHPTLICRSSHVNIKSEDPLVPSTNMAIDTIARINTAVAGTGENPTRIWRSRDKIWRARPPMIASAR